MRQFSVTPHFLRMSIYIDKIDIGTKLKEQDNYLKDGTT